MTAAREIQTASCEKGKRPRSRKHHQQQHQEKDMICVVVRGTSTLLAIPKTDVYHLPAEQKRLVLCEQFNPAAPHSSCRNGRECRWVHADTSRATQKHIHVAWAWRSLEEVSYPLMRPGRALIIEQPTATRDEIPADAVDSGMILKTRCVFDDPKRPASHCAHFYYGRECHLGPWCDFAHVVYVDETSEPGQRAPPPFSHRRQGQYQGRTHSKHHSHTWSMQNEKEYSMPYADQSPFSTPDSSPLPSGKDNGVLQPAAHHASSQEDGGVYTTTWPTGNTVNGPAADHLRRSVTSRRQPPCSSYASSCYTPYSTPHVESHYPSFASSEFYEAAVHIEVCPSHKVVINKENGRACRWRYDPYKLNTLVVEPVCV